MDGVKTTGNPSTWDMQGLTLGAYYNFTAPSEISLKSFVFSQYGLTQTQSESILTYLNQ